MNKALNDTAGSDIAVTSAGLDALVGHPADKMAQDLMHEQGIDISAHRARQLTHDHIYMADLILVMENEQKSIIENWEPTARGKVYRLGEWSNFEVPDPYRQSFEVYKNAFDLIVTGVSDWVTKLKGKEEK